jgi:hypothetical protein
MTARRVVTAPVRNASHATRARSALCIGPPTLMVRRDRPVGHISDSPSAMAQTRHTHSIRGPRFSSIRLQ